MDATLTLRSSSIGKKFVMALSGVVVFGFVIGHMLGNLQIFMGPKAINDYSAFLHNTPSLLWGTRLVLFVAVGAHVVTSTQLALWNREARPIAYAQKKDLATSYAARTMLWSGPLLLLYIVYHIAHLTFGVTGGMGYAHSTADVYANMVHSFRVLPVSILYLLAQGALGLHLYHGAWSLFQSLGIQHPRYDEALHSMATAVAIVVVLGFASVPVAVLAGIVS